MNIWKLDVDFKEFESFKLICEEKNYLKNFKRKITSASKLNGNLTGEKIHLIEGKVKSDFPKFWSVSGTPMLSEKAATILNDIIYNDSELIQLNYSSENYYLINILTVLDAIDYEKSKFRKLETGLVVGLESYEFNPEVLYNHNIFKLLLNGRIYNTAVFVSDKFKNVVEKEKLLGFKFTKVWSD